MSLLNQVLRDLEQDKIVSSSDNKNIFSQVKASTQKKSNNVVTLIVVAVLLLVAVFVAYHYVLPTNAEKQALPDIKPITEAVATEPAVVVPDPVVSEPVKPTTESVAAESALVAPAPIVSDPVKPTTESIPAESAVVAPAPVVSEPVKSITAAAPALVAPVPVMSEPVKPITEERVVKKIDNIKLKPSTTPKAVTQKELNVAPTAAPSHKKITTLSTEQKADRLFLKAKKTLSLLEKTKLLQHVLESKPEHVEAHLLIAHTYLQRGLMNDSIQSLKESLHLLPNNMALTKALAGLLLKNNQEKEALKRLLDINTQTVKDERFLTLLAAAYQQNKFVVKSEESYQQLLDINPDKAEYWLGLAVSLESQKRNNDALVAYRRALALNSLKPVVVNYIKQRINSIN